MIYIVKINDKEYEVEVEKGKANIIKTSQVVLQSQSASVAVPVALAVPAAIASAPTAPIQSAVGEMVTSPMPGTIVDIKTAQGTRVKKGQILLILEAMKMENEIVSPTDGVVAQVFTQKGVTVNTGDALLSIQ